MGALDGEDLAELHRVREYVAAALYAARDGKSPPPEAVEGINRAMAAAPFVRELVRDGGEGLVLVPRREGAPGVRLAALFAEDAAALLAALFAEDAAALLAGSAGSRVRACAAEECVMLFVPAHPSRRWCSPARCGNRARVARCYQRHRAD
ncbi:MULTISPECIES: CGNR zinc finger domain-containing protein [unclassified Streptomyces]|uniref:CGNR zinc finger domain-containing protein n=1 Tax=unclassified Streptomyces TaxID=2593676 RepID=UPI0027E4F1AD|nr:MULTISPECIES: CGNR zinc finger domain-containing protein [unclassified Streptomyces]